MASFGRYGPSSSDKTDRRKRQDEQPAAPIHPPTPRTRHTLFASLRPSTRTKKGDSHQDKDPQNATSRLKPATKLRDEKSHGDPPDPPPFINKTHTGMVKEAATQLEEGTFADGPDQASRVGDRKSPEERLAKTDPVSVWHYSEYLLKLGYKLGATVGTGSYSKVKLVEKVQFKKGTKEKIFTKIACKLIDTRKASKTYVEKFLPRELAILRAISHPNLVSVERIVDLGPMVCLFMEFGCNGDLLDHIQKHGSIVDSQSKKFFRQICHGLKYLHERGIAHRDLKCENVMLFANGVVKLTDFGFARGFLSPVDGDPVTSRTFCGSMAYAAPEIIQATPYFPDKYDMWSLGCVLFIMVTAKMPFNDKSSNQLLRQQMQRAFTYPTMCMAPSACKKVIRDLLNPKPSERPTVEAVLASSWVKPNTERPVFRLAGLARRHHIALNS